MVKRAVLLMLAMPALMAGAFEKVPEAAMSVLKGVRGKGVSSGFVFVDGRYLAPPYKVARYGTAVFVNEVQVTDQIVSWKGFLATQDGASPAPAGASDASAAAGKKGEDDLFDEAPAQKEVEAAKAKAERERDAAAASKFVMNDRSKRLLKRVDAYRTEVRRKLRDGNACFFGSRYARVMVEPRVARRLMEFLPEAMADAANAAALEAGCRAKGFPFMTRAVCEDLLENRAGYLQLVERRRKAKEEESIQRMFDSAKEKQR